MYDLNRQFRFAFSAAAALAVVSITNPASACDVTTGHDPDGAPYIVLNGVALLRPDTNKHTGAPMESHIKTQGISVYDGHPYTQTVVGSKCNILEKNKSGKKYFYRIEGSEVSQKSYGSLHDIDVPLTD